jgi:hypothetical protein
MKIGKVLFVLAFVILVLFISLLNPKTIVCEGEYIEYQDNCCLDRNYNNICDVIDLERESELNGKISGSCDRGGIVSVLNCPGGGSEINLNSEICQYRCNDNTSCEAFDCIVYYCADRNDCRDSKQCVNGKCQ